jgi:uncharacterized protein YuzE
MAKIPMKVKKDTKHDVAYIKLRRGKVASTVELRPGLLFDLDKNGEILGIEVLSITKVAPLLAQHKKQSKVA